MKKETFSSLTWTEPKWRVMQFIIAKYLISIEKLHFDIARLCQSQSVGVDCTALLLTSLGGLFNVNCVE